MIFEAFNQKEKLAKWFVHNSQFQLLLLDEYYRVMIIRDLQFFEKENWRFRLYMKSEFKYEKSFNSKSTNTSYSTKSSIFHQWRSHSIVSRCKIFIFCEKYFKFFHFFKAFLETIYFLYKMKFIIPRNEKTIASSYVQMPLFLTI